MGKSIRTKEIELRRKNRIVADGHREEILIAYSSISRRIERLKEGLSNMALFALTGKDRETYVWLKYELERRREQVLQLRDMMEELNDTAPPLAASCIRLSSKVVDGKKYWFLEVVYITGDEGEED